MRPSQGVGVPVEKGIYFSGAGDQRPNFEAKGGKRQYWGTGNIRKLRLGEQGNKPKPNYYRGTRYQENRYPPPYQGSVGPNRQILGVIRGKSDGSVESAHLILA